MLASLPRQYYNDAIDPEDAIKHALRMTVAYDNDPKFRNQIRSIARSQNFMDSASLPEGALNALMPTIYEIQTDLFYVNGVPLNPLQAPGVTKVSYPRINYYGSMVYTQSEAEANKGRVDIGIENVELVNKRPLGYFFISDLEADQIAAYARSNNVLSAINLVQQKRESAVRAWMRERDLILSQGKPAAGLVGFLSSADVDEIVLSSPLTTANNPEQNVAVLAMAAASIVGRTGGAFVPTTLVLPPSTKESLGNQGRTSNSDKTILQFFKDNRGQVAFDNGTREFEIVHSQQNENFRPGFDAGLMFVRRLEAVEQVVPKNITYSNPIPEAGGYKITFHGEVTSLALKQPRSAVRFVWANT